MWPGFPMGIITHVRSDRGFDDLSAAPVGVYVVTADHDVLARLSRGDRGHRVELAALVHDS